MQKVTFSDILYLARHLKAQGYSPAARAVALGAAIGAAHYINAVLGGIK